MKPQTSNRSAQLPTINNFSTEETNILINEQAENIANQLAGKMTSTQLRRFYHELKAIKEKGLSKQDLELHLGLFQAKVAYNVKRKASYVPQPFFDLIKSSIAAVKKSNDQDKAFNNFLHFIEAIVAYHKFHGGKD